MGKKQDLRDEIIAGRLLISPESERMAGDTITKHLLGIIPAEVNVVGYFAIRGEVDVGMLLKRLREKKHKVGLPAVVKSSKILKLLEYSSDCRLISGTFGVMHPPLDAPEIIPDVLIVPMVGFDMRGNRLGYGGGYYDATIKELRLKNKNILVIGVAYAMQRVEKLPVELHDQKMDIVVTEEGVQSVSPSP